MFGGGSCSESHSGHGPPFFVPICWLPGSCFQVVHNGPRVRNRTPSIFLAREENSSPATMLPRQPTLWVTPIGATHKSDLREVGQLDSRVGNPTPAADLAYRPNRRSKQLHGEQGLARC